LKRIIHQNIDASVAKLMAESGLKIKKIEEEVKKDAY
jgi:hypothetical protein